MCGRKGPWRQSWQNRAEGRAGLQLLARAVEIGEGLLQPAAVLIDQGEGSVEAQVWTVGEEPAAEQWIASQHPAGEADDEGMGMEGIGAGQQSAAVDQ